MGGCTAALLCIRRQEILDASRFKSRLVGRTRRVVQQIRFLVGNRVHLWCFVYLLEKIHKIAWFIFRIVSTYANVTVCDFDNPEGDLFEEDEEDEK